MKETTVHYMHRALSICFKTAVINDIIARSHMDKVPKPQIETFKPMILTPAKARELTAALEDDEQWGLSLTVNLALGLCWDDLDLEAGTMRIERTITMKT